ncbi:transposase [Deinococcus oregonensis]|uniref:Transposase n=1 Tax=Deinococcus oregonensis TaxID=1805970 RepID=A0ABV6B0L9_9DEIO
MAALVGVAPYHRDSGTMRGTSRIWRGRPEIRPVLYMATVASLRVNPTIRSKYDRLLQKESQKSGVDSVYAVIVGDDQCDVPSSCAVVSASAGGGVYRR